MTLVLVWAMLRPVLEPAQRLHRPGLVRPRRLLRPRRLCRRARPDPFRPLAVDHDPDCGHPRRPRRTADRLSDLPPARPLLRAGDARLPAGPALRLRMARLSGSHAADEARQCRRLHAVRRSPPLHAARAGDAVRHHAADTGRSSARASAWRCSRSSRTRPRRRPPASTRWPGSSGPSRSAAPSPARSAASTRSCCWWSRPPSVFGMLVSAQALTVAMFGGVGTVWGPVIGAAILIPLAEILHAEAGRALSRHPGRDLRPRDHHPSSCSRRKACSGRCATSLRKRSATPDRDSTGPAPDVPVAATVSAELGAIRGAKRSAGTGDVVLEVRDLSKSFGGLKAVQDVSFEVRRRRDPRASSARTAPARPRCSTC